MSRGVIAFDRFASFLVGIVLVAAGAFALVWWLDLFSWLPQALNTSAVTDTTSQVWWPWVAGLVGAVLALLGLRWLAGHLPASRVGELTLPGSGTQGKLRAAAAPVAKAAAGVLETAPGVRSVSGRVLRERGQLLARLGATIEAEADLKTITSAADQVAADLARVLERDDLHCRVQLKVATRSRPLPRVR
jgi:hypothetical protein